MCGEGPIAHLSVSWSGSAERHQSKTVTRNLDTNSTVLWWSPSGRDYSRNGILRKLFRELGWHVQDFAPRVSPLGSIEARLRGVPTPDLVWVPCFRHRDVVAASKWARSRGIPLVFDPLISAYDKQVYERRKLAPESRRAARLRMWESKVFSHCDLLLADTVCHAEYFQETHGVPASRVRVVPVGADESIFSLKEHGPRNGPPRVLFYGSFIGLQGADVVVEAAKHAPQLEWTLLGDGPMNSQCRDLAKGCQHIRFHGWVPYAELPNHIADADILLGVFGSTDKAARVIPNKVYQSLACGRVVVTQESTAYPEELRCADVGKSGVAWVRGGDAQHLSDVVSSIARDADSLPDLGVAARRAYERHFSLRSVQSALETALLQLGFGRQLSRCA